MAAERVDNGKVAAPIPLGMPVIEECPLMIGVRLLGSEVVHVIVSPGTRLPVDNKLLKLTTSRDHQSVATVQLVVSGGRTALSACRDFMSLTRELDTSTNHYQGLVQLDLYLSISVFAEVTAVLDELTDFREPKPPATVGRSLIFHTNSASSERPRAVMDDQGVRLFVEGVGRHLPSLLPWRVVSLPGDVKLTLRQESVSSSFTSISTDKTGCAVWECGIILAYCLCQAFLLRGKSSALKLPIGPDTENYGVELGCGTGLVSLALASLGAKMVATDGNDQVLKLAERNLDQNEIPKDRISSHKLMWGSPDDTRALFESRGGRRPSVIVGSDLVYPQSPAEPLLAALDDLVGSDGARVVICLKERTRDSSDFLAKVQARGWSVVDLAQTDRRLIHPDFVDQILRQDRFSLVCLSKSDIVAASYSTPTENSVSR